MVCTSEFLFNDIFLSNTSKKLFKCYSLVECLTIYFCEVLNYGYVNQDFLKFLCIISIVLHFYTSLTAT